MIFIELYLIVCIFFLAGKDADSYQLKDKNAPYDDLNKKRIQRWHVDGAALYVLFVLGSMSIALLSSLNVLLVVVYALLIRLGIYDYLFNKWASLPTTYLGSTATWDKLFIKIFGQNGAIKKSLVFIVLLILINLWRLLIS